MQRATKRNSSKAAKMAAASEISQALSGELAGQRGRRSMPAVKKLRTEFRLALRKVAELHKAIAQQRVGLVLADTKALAKLRKQIKVSKKELKQAQLEVANVAKRLRKLLVVEALKSRALVKQRMLAIYAAWLQNKAEKDSKKALARFASDWKKRRAKVISRKLKARAKQEAHKAILAKRRANAKAKSSVKLAEAIVKARAKKAAVKARAKAKKLATRAKA
jgi:colicin import membrane protein